MIDNVDLGTNEAATLNMASQISDHNKILMERFRPGRYGKGDDIEDFITKCERFYRLTQWSTEIQEITVIGFLEDDAIKAYESVKGRGNYQTKLRTAFGKATSIIEDMSKALSYELAEDSAEEYFEKIDVLVEKLLKHKWDKEELTKCLLMHCTKDEEIKKEIKMRDAKSATEMKSIIKKITEIKTEHRGKQVNTVRTYSEAARINRPQEKQQQWTTRETHREVRRPVQCWNCNGNGHMARECQQRKQIYCYGCKELGHIRKECPKIQCQKCKLKGHYAQECYTNIEKRERYGNWNQNNENQRNMYQTRNGNFQRNGETTRFQSQNQKRNYNNQVAGMQLEDGYIQQKKYYEITDENGREDEYPNDEAPISEERIGAMQ